MKIRSILILTAGLFVATAQAQYKYVGPDGRVIYSDTPPPANLKGAQKKDLSTGAPAAGGGTTLPFALQQASRNFPVSLYTGASCPACDSGRTLLTQRGIPFTEKTVRTSEDIEALKKVAGAASIPLLLIGSNKQTGFESGAWNDALDVAGYPKTSQLPTGYKQAPAISAAPQAVPAKVETKSETAPATATSSTPPAPAPDPNRPSWFKGF